MVFAALDMPFSFVGDILTLPYTLGYTWANQPVAGPTVTIANQPAARLANPSATSPSPAMLPNPNTLPATLPNLAPKQDPPKIYP
ncbi:MAG: hypothetical protein K8U57_17650 [Planctomycetes bacterium]|nr:hypothetical protein [Planctomycetota bacterium]